MQEENAIALSEASLVPTVNRVREQVQLIQHVMKQTMKDKEHFGVIPGCKKPSLLKPGAEKLLLTFKMAPSYSELSVTESDDFISYRIQCSLMHIPTSNLMGSGLGACNSKENKYTTRTVYENKATEEDRRRTISEGERDGKNGTKYKVLIIPQNPWDLQNTLYKMACKRALIAAVLNVTAASDIFTQDIDENFVPERHESPPVEPPKRKSETQQPSPEIKSQNPNGPSEKQLKRLWAISKSASWEETDIKKYYEVMFQIDSSHDLTQEQYKEVCDYMEANPNGFEG